MNDLQPVLLCSFCDTDQGVTPEQDVKGHNFNCCGGCWARVIHAIIPDDVLPIIAWRRSVNRAIIEWRRKERAEKA